MTTLLIFKTVTILILVAIALLVFLIIYLIPMPVIEGARYENIRLHADSEGRIVTVTRVHVGRVFYTIYAKDDSWRGSLPLKVFRKNYRLTKTNLYNNPENHGYPV